MVNSPFVVTQIMCLYLYVVLKWGPNHMKNRPAYSFRTIMLLYNFSQICFNVYLYTTVSRTNTLIIVQ